MGESIVFEISRLMRKLDEFWRSALKINIMIQEQRMHLEILAAREKHVSIFKLAYETNDFASYRDNQLHVDGYLFRTAVEYENIELCKTFITDILDIQHALSELPDGRRNFLSILELSVSYARFLY